MKINKFYIIATVLFSLLITSCNNEDTMLLQTNSTKHNFEINASLASLEEDDDNTRASLVSNMITQWAKGDGISVINLSTKKVLGGNLVAQTAGTKTTFTGTVTGSISAGDKLAFLYPAKNITTEKTFTSSDFVYDLFGSQTTTTPFVAKYTYTVPNNSKDITLSDAEFSFLSAYLKMNLSTLPGNTEVTNVTIENMGTSLSCMPNADGSDLTATGTLGDINIDLSATTKEQGYTVVKFSSAPIAKQSQDRTVSVTCGDDEYVSSMVSNEIKSNAYVNVNVSAFEKNINVPFEDIVFKTTMVRNYDTNGDREISIKEAEKITSLSIDHKSISSLKGIEYFKNLTELDCSGNNLTLLDISKNTELAYLSCNYNKLTSLDISKNIALKKIDCSSNQLTTLDVTKNSALENLSCDYNQLTALDISKNTQLTELHCIYNQLTELDVSKNIALKKIDCSSNQLSSLDISKNTALIYLECSSDQLSSLDVSKNTQLTELRCSYNQLTELDVTKNSALENLSCDYNQLTALDISKNTQLTMLHCSYNQLTALDVSKNTALKYFYCSNNQLSSLDVSKNTALINLECSKNQLTTLDVNKNTALELLFCDSNQLTTIDVSYNTALVWFDCHDNPLTHIFMYTNQRIGTFKYPYDAIIVRL